MNLNLILQNIDRRNNGYFNIAMQANPHPSRRRKAAAIDSQSISRTAAFFAVVLAGEFIVQGAQALKDPPRKTNVATNKPPTTSNAEAADRSVPMATEHSNLGASENHLKESNTSSIQPASPSTLIEAQGSLVHNSSSSVNLTDRSVAPSRTVFAEALDAANNSSRPHKRSVDDQTGSFSDSIVGDHQNENHPLIAARTKAVRNLLGKAAEGTSDTHLLFFANKIHSDATKDPNSGSLIDDDLALWNEEARIWCAENGGDKHPVSKEKCLEALKEAWDLALDPPPPPSGFKDWRKIRNELETNMSRAERARLKFTPSGSVGEAAQINVKTTRLYYEQFIEYLENNLDRFVAAKAIANAATAGLSRIEMEIPLDAVRTIPAVYVATLDDPRPSIRLTRESESGRPAAYIFPFRSSSGKDGFGFVGPNGKLRIYPTTQPLFRFRYNEEGKLELRLNEIEILRALGIPFSMSNTSPLVCTARNLKACPTTSFIIDKGEGLGYFTYLGQTIKQVMEGQIRENAVSSINAFKGGNDGTDALDKLFGIVIPFYDQIIGGITDPGHKIEIKDIAFDLIDLGITLSTIGGASIKALRAGFKAAKATLVAGEGTVAALRAFSTNIKAGKLLKKTGRELFDFISPPFTGDITKRMVDSANFPTTGLKRRLQEFDSEYTLRCTKGIFEDCFLYRRPVQQQPLLVGGEQLNDFYRRLDAKFKHPYLPEDTIKKFFDERAEIPIPDTLYRSQPRPGTESITGLKYTEVGFVGPAHSTYDDVLVWVIKHTASEKGIKDKAASLSATREVSEEFMKKNEGYFLYSIHKPEGVQPFRRIENIIKYDGLRLVKEGKITEEELMYASLHVLLTQENEVFYVAHGGKIPQHLVVPVQ